MMTNIAIPVPPSLQSFREPLREFIAGMVRKLDMNSHKKTPEKQDVETIIGLLRGELDEFEQQLKEDKTDENALVELQDAANYALLAFIALRNDGVKTKKERMIDEFLEIDPIVGKIYCKKTRPGSQYKIGMEIFGNHRQGYVDIKLQVRRDKNGSMSASIPRSHLIWWKHNGKWPTGVIDHINRIKDDDRIENLRDSTFSDNGYNKEKQSKFPRHVTPYLPTGRQHLKWYGKFVYQKYHKGVNVRCAYYDTPEEASIQGALDWEEKINRMEKL